MLTAWAGFLAAFLGRGVMDHVRHSTFEDARESDGLPAASGAADTDDEIRRIAETAPAPSGEVRDRLRSLLGFRRPGGTTPTV